MRVIHDDALVAPLFIAKGAYDYTANAGTSSAGRLRFTERGPPAWATAAWFGANTNRDEQDPRVGKGRVMRDGKVVWLELGTRKADRRADAKHRFLDRDRARRYKR